MLKSIYLYAGMATFFLVSCSKSNNDDNVVPPSSPKLIKYVLGSPIPAGGIDTLLIASYTWDAANRCTRIVNNAIVVGNKFYVDNYYNGADSLISSRKLSEANDPSYISWEYFGYDGNGKMNYDSAIDDLLGSPNVAIYKYTGSAGTFTLNMHLDVTGPNAYIRANYHHVYDGNGNIVSEVDSNYTYSSFSGSYDFNSKATSTVSYDNKPNPFYRILPHRLVLLEHENILSEDFYPFSGISQKNNITAEQRVINPTTSGLATYNNTITYQYNSNGYPTEMTFTDQETGDIYKGYFYYQ